jgi:hypothetical protein
MCARMGKGSAVRDSLARLGQQPLHREWLRHESVDRNQDAGGADYLGGATGHEVRLGVRADGGQSVRQFFAVDPGHHDIGEEHLDGPRVLLSDARRLFSVLRLK